MGSEKYEEAYNYYIDFNQSYAPCGHMSYIPIPMPSCSRHLNVYRPLLHYQVLGENIKMNGSS